MPGVRIQKDVLAGGFKKVILKGILVALLNLETLRC